jgi:hyperosmotically inducible periplasmic protein
MKFLTSLILIAALAFLNACERHTNTGGSGNEPSQSSGQGKSTDISTVSPNNTGKNERDRSDSTLTPSNQSGSNPDLEITRSIRRAVTSNDKLSVDAKNVKIVTINGKVTLRGPVQSEEEKQALATAAKDIAGVTEVDDQLEVKTKQ